MLIIYDKITKEIISITGFGIPLPPGWNVEPTEPLPENQSYFHIYEEAKIAEIWGAYNTGETLELIFDETGTPVDVKCIMPE